MRPSIRAPHGLKGSTKGGIPAGRPAAPPKASLPVPQGREDTRPSLTLKRKVDQVSGATPSPGPRPKTPNLGKGPTAPATAPPRGKPTPMVFQEKGEKGGEKGGKGVVPTNVPPPGAKGQTPKAGATPTPPTTKPPSALGTVMPPKSKSAPEVAAEKAQPPPDGPKPPASQPPGFAEKRFLPVPKGKAPEPTTGGKPVPTVLPKGASKGQPTWNAGKAGKGSVGNVGKAQQETVPPKAEPEGGKAGKGKSNEQPAAKGDDGLTVQMRLRNVESLQTRLLAELGSLPEANRPEVLAKIFDALARVAPKETLQKLVEKLAADGLVSSNGAAATPGEEPTAETAEPAEGGEEEPTLAQSMEDFILNVENAASTDYGKTWAALSVPREAEVEVLSALLEVAVQKTNTFDLIPRVVVELARTRKVTIANLETALKELAKKVEDLVQTNDQAWHLISYFLVYLFPRTRSSDWGLLFGGWNFPSWWKATEDILQEAHKYRAFDILVLSLQIMQEKSGKVIKQLPVWSDPGRASQVRQILCKWGEMDEASILETLSANGVELGK